MLIFGAGASYGNPDCSPEPPPLGANLFAALRARGGIAATVDTELASVFSENFEAGMARFFEDRHLDLPAFLREMAVYFSQFVPGPTNYYRNIAEAAVGKRDRVIFVTTNYDLLIEIAITDSGSLVSYAGPPVPPKNLSVLKIHGSCNFLPDLGGSGIRGISFDVKAGGSILHATVCPVSSTKDIKFFCRMEDSLAPAIALYMAGKKLLYCPAFIESQQQDFVREIARAKKIFVVGLKVNPADSHIWEPLARSGGWLGYVGGEPEYFRAWASSNGRRHAHIIASTFQDALPDIIRVVKKS